MKTSIALFFILIASKTFACDLSNAPTEKAKAVTERFSGSSFCLDHVFCTNTNAWDKAREAGYNARRDCKVVSSSEGGLAHVSASSSYRIECTKQVMVPMSKAEQRKAKCEKLLQCSVSEQGNTSLIIEMFNKLKCDKVL